MFTDKTLTCRMCGKPFLFPADEQAFYAEKGFTSAPSYCRPCRAERRKAAYDAALRDPSKRFMYRCGQCGKAFVVVQQFRNADPRVIRCPACVPVGMPPYTDDDRRLNEALGFPRHLG